MSKVDRHADGDEEQCQQTLDGHFLGLRFPASLESAYIEHNAEARRKQLALTALLGLLIFNVSAIVNRSMFADIQESVLNVQVWVSAWILLLTTFVWFTPRPSWRE